MPTFPERPEAPEVFYRSAVVHKKRGNKGAEAKALRDFISRYKGKKAAVPRVVEAHVRLGDIELERLADEKNGRKRKKLRDSADASHSNVFSGRSGWISANPDVRRSRSG